MAPAASGGGHLMDIEKLVEAVKLCGSTPKVNQCKQCAYWTGGDMSKCIPKMTAEAATALQYLREGADEVNTALREQLAENEKLRADLARVTAERDAAIKTAQKLDKIVGRVWGEEEDAYDDKSILC